MEQEYYIGLDIGTSSVGWAVTDMNYQIIKRHGKALWGSRLFASANTAEERRGFRTARRRLDRRNWRINILQNLYVSPAVKREIWQTLKILKEIQKVMGGEPKRVFIEMAREHQESKRTDSRKSWLMDLYKAFKLMAPL